MHIWEALIGLVGYKEKYCCGGDMLGGYGGNLRGKEVVYIFMFCSTSVWNSQEIKKCLVLLKHSSFQKKRRDEKLPRNLFPHWKTLLSMAKREQVLKDLMSIFYCKFYKGMQFEIERQYKN